MSNLKLLGAVFALILALMAIHYLLIPLRIVLMLVGAAKYLIFGIFGASKWLFASMLSGNVITIALFAFVVLVAAGGVVRARKEARCQSLAKPRPEEK